MRSLTSARCQKESCRMGCQSEAYIFSFGVLNTLQMLLVHSSLLGLILESKQSAAQ